MEKALGATIAAIPPLHAYVAALNLLTFVGCAVVNLGAEAYAQGTFCNREAPPSVCFIANRAFVNF